MKECKVEETTTTTTNHNRHDDNIEYVYNISSPAAVFRKNIVDKTCMQN